MPSPMVSNSSFDQLSETDQAIAAEVVERCMLALEQGQPVEVDSMVQSYPALAEPLRRCLTSLQTIHDAIHATPTKGADGIDLPYCLGDFELEAILGRGGMGVVYLATQLSLGRHVALKLLSSCSPYHSKRLQRFKIEAQSAAMLSHSNIVPVYAVGEEAGFHFYAMKYICGQTLDHVDGSFWIKDRYRPVIELGIVIADALQHAHELGIVHRDVKPSNLIQDSTGKVWITDFGLARQLSNDSLTMSGELIGTTHYMSPEQAAGLPVDARTDIYSLAATLYELATGKRAVSGEGIREVLKQLEFDQPIAPRKIRQDIPFDFETVLLKSLSRDRNDRYATAAEMRDDFQRFLDERPVLCRRPHFTKRLSRWMAKHRGLILIGGIGLVLSTIISCIGLMVTQSHLRTSQARYWKSRQLLDKWNESLIPQLEDETSAPSVRTAMLGDTISYYESYLQEHNGDFQLSSDVQLARRQLAQALSHQGNFHKAAGQWERIALELQQASKTESKKIELAATWNELGLVYLRLGRVDDAIQTLKKGSDLYENSMTEPRSSSSKSARLRWAASLTNLANALNISGQEKDADSHLQEAEKLYRDLLRDSELSKPELGLLAQLLDHRASHFVHAELPKAIRMGEEAIDLHRLHCQNEGATFSSKQRFGNSLHNLAAMQFSDGGLDVAIDLFEKACDVRRHNMLENPSRLECRLELATSKNALGLAYAKQADVSKALQCFDEASGLFIDMRIASRRKLSIEVQFAFVQVLLNRESLLIDDKSPEFSHTKYQLDEEIDRLRSKLEESPQFKEDFDRILAQWGKLQKTPPRKSGEVT
jgi:eukaryotic-like serine/threonine-protein kinase